MAPRGRREEVSVWEDERVLEVDGGGFPGGTSGK